VTSLPSPNPTLPSHGPATEIIAQAIAENGPISFEHFMALALYAPEVGYYQQPHRPIGRSGDFYTSVSVGPAFGMLLAEQLVSWSRTNQSTGTTEWHWIEAGAHDGQLACDILKALDLWHPEDRPRVHYHILEPSAVARQRQEQFLGPCSSSVRWSRDWSEIPPAACRHGILFANELLDALPLQRWSWQATSRFWLELGVDVQNDRFVTTTLPENLGRQPAIAPEITEVLPDGWILERCPAAEQWWNDAATALSSGRLLAFDYGDDSPQGCNPNAPTGTARAYFRHQRCDDLLDRPGAQDLTAHVAFDRIRAVAELQGWQTDALLPQGRWLGRVATEILRRNGPDAVWLAAQSRALQSLTHPGHLGLAFKVLSQHRP
jgi:SAM-dependent MidA family methyltransferase